MTTMELTQITINDFLLFVFNNDSKNVLQSLKNGFNADSKDKDGRNGLHVASQHGYLKIIKILLSYGADAQVKFFNETPCFIAKRNQRDSCFNLLKKINK